MIKKVDVKFKKLNLEAKVPFLSTEHAAAFDVYSIEDYELKPLETKPIGTGLAMEIPEGKCYQVWDRSGMGVKGIHRFAGLIDSDYRGEFKIVLFNSTEKPFQINKGDRIAQIQILDYYTPSFEEVLELSDTSRGDKGFGSSGMK